MKKIKFAVFIFIPIFLFSCKKPIGVRFSGKIIDAQTLLPISNFKVRLNYKNPSGNMGFGLYGTDNIAEASTNNDGEYTMVIKKMNARDSKDFYQIQAPIDNEYFGGGKKINAYEAESYQISYVEDIKVFKNLKFTLLINHLGTNNPNDFVLTEFKEIDSITSFTTRRTDLFNGNEPLQQNQYYVFPNIKYEVSWRGRKNNVLFGTIKDSVIFTTIYNEYNIYY